MRRVNLPVALLACTLPLAACSDDPAPPSGESIVWSSTNQVQREAAVKASIGVSAAEAMTLVFLAELDSAEGRSCPTRTQSGKTVTYEGGCTGASGTRYSGRVVTDNVPSFLDLGGMPRSGAFSLRFEKFRVEGGQADGLHLSEVDGTIEQSEQAADLPFVAKIDATFTGAVAVKVNETMKCEPFEGVTSCSVTSSSEGEIVGLGYFLIIADLTHSDAQALGGDVALAGNDVLHVDFDAEQQGCAPITIQEDPAGSICLQSSDPPVEDSPVVGKGISCTNDGIEISVDVKGAADRVEVDVEDTTHTETHVLSVSDTFPDQTNYAVKLTVGQNTTLDCFGGMTVRYQLHIGGRDVCELQSNSNAGPSSLTCP